MFVSRQLKFELNETFPRLNVLKFGNKVKVLC